MDTILAQIDKQQKVILDEDVSSGDESGDDNSNSDSLLIKQGKACQKNDPNLHELAVGHMKKVIEVQGETTGNDTKDGLNKVFSMLEEAEVDPVKK